MQVQPAPELSQVPPDARGIFVRREDRSIFVGTGQVMYAVPAAPGQSGAQSSSSYGGPVVEVVITHGTAIYRDTTELPEVGSGTSGEVAVQQTVASPARSTTSARTR